MQFVPKRVSSGFLTEHSFAIRVKESLNSLYKETATLYCLLRVLEKKKKKKKKETLRKGNSTNSIRNETNYK